MIQEFLHMLEEDTGTDLISDAITRCVVCGKTEQTKQCGRCNARTYCSEKCQKGDWPTHKAACKAMANRDPLQQYFATVRDAV